MYLHDNYTASDVEIKTLKQKFDTLENLMKTMAKDLEEKDLEIKMLKGNQINLEKAFDESQIDLIKKELEAKDAQINGLELRLDEIEKSHQKFKKHQEKKMKDLDKQKAGKIVVTEANKVKENNYKCRECDFTTSSRQGLKIHNSKTHSKTNFEEFPAACNICEKVLENEITLKKHKKSEHTFHVVKYQFDECEFMANQIETL